MRGDLQLVVKQVTKEYGSPQMGAYLDEVRKLERRFDGIQMEHIPRGENVIADELSKMVAGRGPVPAGVFVEQLYQPSVGPRPTPGDPSSSTQGAPGAVPTPAASSVTLPVPGASTSREDTSAKPKEERTPGTRDAMAAERAAPPWAADLLRYIRDRALTEDDREAERVAG